MTTVTVGAQTWWSVGRGHAGVLVRPGGAWPVLAGCLAAGVGASLLLLAVLDDPDAVRLVAGLPVALALASGMGVHAGWWCEGGAFDGALALVPDRRRLLVGQVAGTSLVTGAVGTVGTYAVVLTAGVAGPTGIGPSHAPLVGLLTVALTAQGVALGVLCRGPVPAALAGGALWVVVPVLLTSLRTWLDGGARTFVDALVAAGPMRLAASALAGDDWSSRTGALLGEVVWAVALGAVAWAILSQRDH